MGSKRWEGFGGTGWRLGLHYRALLIFGTGEFFVVGTEQYIVRCLAASQDFIYKMPVAHRQL